MKVHWLSVDYYFPHFQQRLKERYNLDISLEEYLELNSQEVNVMYDLSNHSRLATIIYKNVEIIVIKHRSPSILKTVLTIGQSFPIPINVRRLGIKKETFENDLRELIKKVEALKNLLIEINDKRIFFVNRPGGYPHWMYNMAYCWVRDGQIPLRIIVENQIIEYKAYNLFEVQDSSSI